MLFNVISLILDRGNQAGETKVEDIRFHLKTSERKAMRYFCGWVYNQISLRRQWGNMDALIIEQIGNCTVSRYVAILESQCNTTFSEGGKNCPFDVTSVLYCVRCRVCMSMKKKDEWPETYK